jgi:hypothetical protein
MATDASLPSVAFLGVGARRLGPVGDLSKGRINYLAPLGTAPKVGVSSAVSDEATKRGA